MHLVHRSASSKTHLSVVLPPSSLELSSLVFIYLFIHISYSVIFISEHRFTLLLSASSSFLTCQFPIAITVLIFLYSLTFLSYDTSAHTLLHILCISLVPLHLRTSFVSPSFSLPWSLVPRCSPHSNQLSLVSCHQKLLSLFPFQCWQDS